MACVDSSGHGDNESLMAEGLAGRRFPVPSEGATDRQPTLSGMSGSVPGIKTYEMCSSCILQFWRRRKFSSSEFN